jgi:hypothetical protein
MDNSLEQMTTPFSGDNILAETILQLKKEFNLTTAIETGTYKGATTLWLDKYFEDVHTTEIDSKLYDNLRNTFKGTKIRLWCAGSQEALPEILNHIDDSRPFIFLDSHWYVNPLLSELDTIAKAGIKPVLAIHDFKVPNHPELGFDEYPKQGIVYDFAYIESHLEKIYGKDGYVYFYNSEANGDKRGCIFIYSK